MRITTIQARTQGTFEVEEFSDRGFGGHFQAPMGPGRRPDGGGGGGGGRRLRVAFLVRSDPLSVIQLFVYEFYSTIHAIR